MFTEIKTINLLLPYKLGSVNCYLIKTDTGYILIDTGPSNERIILEKELENAGCKPGHLKLIILTHGDFDHTGNAAYIRKSFCTKVAMHDSDSGMTEHGDMFWNRKRSFILIRIVVPILFGFGKSERFKPDLYLDEGYDLSEFGFDAKVLHIPGHSKGSIGILAADGSLFCGDLLENKDKPVLNSIIDDSGEANTSVEKLKSLEINAVYPGHGKPFSMDLFIQNQRKNEDKMTNEIETINAARRNIKYKSVIATRRGAPDSLKIIENDLRAPKVKEVRIRILATPVCLPDVQARYGHTPFAPKIPFVPGYAIIGVVDAIGEDVTNATVGDRVGALTMRGGYAEYIFLDKEQLIPVPSTLDPAEAITLILNYLVAYQVLHRKAKVKAGDRVLIIGASGGVGTAFLQLCKLADLKMYGIASQSKHNILTEMDAIPIDYRTQDFVEIIQRVEPDGLDAVFDGMGGDYVQRGLSVLRRGGTLVEYGNPLTFPGMLRLLAKVLVYNLLPNGKKVKVYGTTAPKFGRRPFLEDWAELFKLLEEDKIKPIIAKKFPILEAAQANELLGSGKVIGNIVLLSPELL